MMVQVRRVRVKVLEVYHYQGVNRSGKTVKGEIRATGIGEVKHQLRQQGVMPSLVKRQKTPVFARVSNISTTDITVASRQIATMLGAGIPLVRSIELIAGSAAKRSMSILMQSISAKVQAGLPLSEALREYPRYFDDLYCALVKSGEHSGALDRIFERIAAYKEKAEALKSKIKKALFYPVAVLTIAVMVTMALLMFVIPQFAGLFASFGAALPAFTLWVLAVSDYIQQYGWSLLLMLFSAGYLLKYLYRKRPAYRAAVDALLLKLPVIGGILRKAAVARFARTLATTFTAGVPLIQALESAADAAGNEIYREAILQVRDDVATGQQIFWSMKQTGRFPDMVVQMVLAGEESGALDSMLAKVAAIYEQEVDDAVDGLSSLLEPVIMAVLGIVIGGLVIAMYLPMLRMGSVV